MPAAHYAEGAIYQFPLSLPQGHEYNSFIGAVLFYVYVISRASTRLQKKTPWPFVRKRTIPTERPPLVGEI
jgi:hypothetical protein